MKYKLTANTKKVQGITLHQIIALKDFSDVKKGDLGGWIESTKNLSQTGNVWISSNVSISGDSVISGEGGTFGNIIICDNYTHHSNTFTDKKQKVKLIK